MAALTGISQGREVKVNYDLTSKGKV